MDHSIPDTPDQATESIPVDPRAGYIAGLRQLADVLEQHPEVPLPFQGHGMALTFSFFRHGDDNRAAMAAAAKALPCQLQKAGSDEYFDLNGKLAGLKIQLTAFRGEVCERVVVGTREVTEEIPDPAAPKVIVTKTVEDVEWRCNSLLADRTEVTSAVTS